MAFLYYYTDEDTLSQIIKYKQIRAGWNQNNLLQGTIEGVLFVEPDESDNNNCEVLLTSNFDDSKFTSGNENGETKIRYYIKVNNEDLPGVIKRELGKRSVWLHQGDVDLSQMLTEGKVWIGYTKHGQFTVLSTTEIEQDRKDNEQVEREEYNSAFIRRNSLF